MPISPRLVACLLLLVLHPLARAQVKEAKVTASTRLDWAFAAQGFGKDAGKLPAAYDSVKQRYQLFVPKGYDKARAWPLIVFISPGDQASGWTNWKGVCEKEGVFFAAPFAAGNSVPAGQRTRIVLDVLDDVRRHYRIDPDQTYLSGFSGGGRMSCAIAFALPEYFGGIAPVCGTNPVPGAAYLRHRAQERLSVALITGETDFNRLENEVYMAPWLKDVGIRAKLWVAPKLGHAVPGEKTLGEVYAWLKDDLKRRQTAAKDRPKLAILPDEAPAGPEQAQRYVDTAQGDLKDPERVWRGVALLQGAAQRWPKSEAAQQARKLLQQLGNDAKLLELVGDQGAQDEVQSLSAQARALERFGQTQQAIQAWSLLAQNYPDSAVGREALKEMERLKRKK